jgi:hypothetical protein
MKEENARDSVTEKEASVLLFGVGTALRKFLLYSELLVVVCGRTLEGHQLTPKLVYFLVLREETVAAEVHSVSVITSGTRNTADIFAFLKNDRLDVGLLKKLVSGCQTRRTRADDYCCFLVHSNRTPCLFIYYRRKKPKKVSSFPNIFSKILFKRKKSLVFKLIRIDPTVFYRLKLTFLIGKIDRITVNVGLGKIAESVESADLKASVLAPAVNVLVLAKLVYRRLVRSCRSINAVASFISYCTVTENRSRDTRKLFFKLELAVSLVDVKAVLFRSLGAVGLDGKVLVSVAIKEAGIFFTS